MRGCGADDGGYAVTLGQPAKMIINTRQTSSLLEKAISTSPLYCATLLAI